eukprot:7560684-Pyramimonas_sp.AAC.2
MYTHLEPVALDPVEAVVNEAHLGVALGLGVPADDAHGHAQVAAVQHRQVAALEVLVGDLAAGVQHVVPPLPR